MYCVLLELMSTLLSNREVSAVEQAVDMTSVEGK